MANRRRLFAASFTTLVVAGVGFAIRGAILADWATQFGFTKTELGTITGGGLVGFGVVILAASAQAICSNSSRTGDSRPQCTTHHRPRKCSKNANSTSFDSPVGEWFGRLVMPMRCLWPSSSLTARV